MNTQTHYTGNQDRDAEAPAVQAQEALKSASAVRAGGKSPSAFRTISEVADELKVQQHVLRFWETKFTQIKPLKRGGGRRYYRPEDIALLRRIHHLLYTEGYTIKGVQKLIRGQGRQAFAGPLEKMPEPAIEPIAHTTATIAPFPTAVTSVETSQPAQPPISSKQRKLLEAMLGDLKDLRDMIRKA